MTRSKIASVANEVRILETREEIDKVDRELIYLLETRMELCLRGTRTVKDKSRDESIVANALDRCSALLGPTFVEKLMRLIVDESNRLRGAELQLVAFQGEHGAYGEIAARELVPDGAYLGFPEFADVFEGVSKGLFDLGVVPVENSLEGAVTQVNNLLTETDLKVIGEATVPIRHCLLANKGTELNEISVVYSHPQALAQCRDFLMRNNLEERQFYDTAGAAKMLERECPRAAAAIASALSAERYGLETLAEGIEDADSNQTRFLLLSRKKYAGQGNKCSLIFAVKHEAGALSRLLSLFSDADINLTRIASMPRRIGPSRYTFFLDFKGSDHDEKIKAVLSRLADYSVDHTFLGCYPKWTPDKE